MKSFIKFLMRYALISTLYLLSNNLYSQDPNIIIIIADDMGWNQVSSNITNNVDGNNYGSDFYETPVIDQLASEGIAFPNAYVNGANCAPTRAALLSGQYAARPTNNVFNVDNLNRGNGGSLLVGPDMGLPSGIDEIPKEAITIAETMKTAGYATIHLGKYHVGENEATNFSNNAATDQGFDVNYGGGTKGAPGNYFASSSAPYTFHANIGPELDAFADPYTATESLLLAGDNSLTGTKKHVTDAMADAAMDYMDTYANNDTKPFFMHFSNFAIHGPYNTANARPDLRDKYIAKKISNPSMMDHDINPGLAAIAEGMDQTIGRLIDYLKTTDDPRNPGHSLSENTIVYFISDNGDAVKRNPQYPLKGMKGEYYEGGIRSITFAWTEPASAGKPTYTPMLANMGAINQTPIMSFDLYPTMVEAGGGTLPAAYDIDGVSQWQMLTNGTPMTRESLFWHFPGYLIDSKRDSRPVTVIRKGDYKLIHNYETADYELYNLINDLGETTNLLPSTDQTIIDLANGMITDMRAHLTDTNAPLPTYRSDGTTVPMPTFVTLSSGGGGGGPCEAPVGYEALWNFDIANGTNDASGNNHNPVATNGTPTYDLVDFKEGDQSIVFDGSTSIRYNNNPFMYAATSARSISVWVKPTTLTGIQEILDEGGNNRGIAMRLNGSNLESIIKQSASVTSQLSTAFPNDGGWHHIALVYDGANTKHTLYIDGIEATTDNTAPSNVPVHTGKGGIGGKISGTDSFGNTNDCFFIGKMDAFALYETVLTIAEVEAASCNPVLNIDSSELESYKDITFVYPNPVENQINIKILIEYSNAAIQIVNLLGQEVYSNTFKNLNVIEIPIQKLTTGHYFIKINIDNRLSIKRILKE